MSDVTKCEGGDSPLCADCWRKLAPTGQWQAWMAVPLYDGGKCEEYWKAEDGRKAQDGRLGRTTW